jgi:hypothetical protein
MDPFLSGQVFTTYDGNPAISFSIWAEKFQDLINLFTVLTEKQKLARLKFCLSGPARSEFEAISPPASTLEDAINYLKSKFENDNTRSIARETLSICKMAPGEKVFEFASRLNNAVRAALSGETEIAIRKRLLEEFLDRLSPDLKYEVKARRPSDYTNAFELAQHFELLQSARKVDQTDIFVKLAGKMETMTVNGGGMQSTSSAGPGGHPTWVERHGHLHCICEDCSSTNQHLHCLSLLPPRF